MLHTRMTIAKCALAAATTLLLLTGSAVASPPAQDPAVLGEITLTGTVASKISYQGQLTDAGGNPLSGSYNLVFQLWNDASAGSQVGSNVTRNGVAVSGGLFTVELDVPQSAFNGQALWLRIQVSGQWLSPRQALLPVPYAFSLVPGALVEGPALAGLSVVNTNRYLLPGAVNSAGYFKHSFATGVYGTGMVGVSGEATSGSGVSAVATTGKGIWAKATGGGNAVQAEVTAGGYAVYAVASGGNAARLGYAGYFEGKGDMDNGILVKAGNYGYSGDFYGPVLVRGRSGNEAVSLGEGLDYAEAFDVSDQERVSAGCVLVIDTENPGKLTTSTRPYDTRVAGIAAGANGLGSGVRLGAGQFDQDVALGGRVYCNVDATEVGVEPGDLLTTSARPGYAMKAADYARAQGAILGKAMQRLDKGQAGQILVLVTLQ